MYLIILLTVTITSCTVEKNKDNAELINKSKSEILKTEDDFETMVKEKGIAEGFAFFADENAVVKTKDSLIKGREEIKNYYNSRMQKDVTLIWKPDFVDVSASGDLGYTYGKYIFNAKDSAGKQIESKGIFHTVWKKQKDGKWKYVWD